MMNSNTGVRSVLSIGFCLALILAVLAVSPAWADSPDAPATFVEIATTDTDLIRALAADGFDVAGVNRKAGTVGVVLRGDDLQRLETWNLPFSIVETSRPLGSREEALGQYMDPAEVEAEVDRIVALYPEIAKKVFLSDTLFEGHRVYAVKITKDVELDEDKPSFLMDCQHHAREVLTPEIAVDMIDFLTANYGEDSRVTEWVDRINIWVVPVVNPDGAAHVFSGDNMWRKNRNPLCPVDINRNYGWNWAACWGSSGSCWDGTYRGPSPISEPETQAMVSIMDDVRAIFYLSYHQYGEYILYPYGCGDPDELEAIDEVGQALNSILENDDGLTGSFDAGPGWRTIYTTDGSSDDEAYGNFGMIGFTIEVGSLGFQPDYDTWRDISVERQRTAWQFFLDRTLSTPSVQGHVTDAETGEPLLANTTLDDLPMTSGEVPRRADRFGRYCRIAPPNTTVTITFSHPGYCSQTHTVQVGTDPTILDVQLELGTHPASADPFPADGAKNQDLQQTLTWSGADGAAYDVYFGTDINPPLVGTSSGTSYTPLDLEIGQTYYWRVDVRDECGPVPGPLWSFSTYSYLITRVVKKGGPFRLKIFGEGFTGWSHVYIDGVPVPLVKHKSSVKMTAKKGRTLKNMVPKGQTVAITVEDDRGGGSPEFLYTR